MSMSSINVAKQANLNTPETTGTTNYATTREEDNKHQPNHR